MRKCWGGMNQEGSIRLFIVFLERLPECCVGLLECTGICNSNPSCASCYNRLELAVKAQEQGADYVAFGRFFPSRTKPQAVPADVALLHQAKIQLHLPIVAIGGITAQNGAQLVAAGADMLAVVDAVFAQKDVLLATRQLANCFGEAASS